MLERQLQTGEGWRLGWHPAAERYQGLVGSDEWAIELTTAEWQELGRLALSLAETMQQMAAELMDEERISCEAEGDHLWVEVEGFPNAYSLRFILQHDRRAEGYWPDFVVPSLLQAMKESLDLSVGFGSSE